MAINVSNTTLEMQISSVLSLIGTIMVLLTWYYFPKLRKLRYVEIVYYIALNDFIASIGTVFGNAENGTLECWIQGIVTTYNFLCSIFWTNVVAYQMYTIVVQNKDSTSDLTIYHIICWGLPLFLTFIPLTTNTYGEADDSSGWCFISDRSNSPSWGIEFWNIAAFYFWVWISILFVIVLFILTAQRIANLRPVPKAVMSCLWKMGLYPSAMIVCWIIASYDDTNASIVGNYNTWKNAGIYNILGSLLPPLQGCLLALIFFSSNEFVRRLWYSKIYGVELPTPPGSHTRNSEYVSEKQSLHASLIQFGDDASVFDEASRSSADSSFNLRASDWTTDRYSSSMNAHGFAAMGHLGSSVGVNGPVPTPISGQANGNSSTLSSAISMNNKI